MRAAIQSGCCAWLLVVAAAAFGREAIVAGRDQLAAAVHKAQPGDRIRIAPGEYRGGLTFSNVRGTRSQRIVIAAQDPKRPPVFQGGGLQFSDPAYLTLQSLVIRDAPYNGLNIDDGGSFDTPARGIRLDRIEVHDVGPKGNRDGIKLSGVDDFLVTNCIVNRWGSGGSGIDMVGCHDGRIERCSFEHGDRIGANAVQTKGGSRNITIHQCSFNHAGQRAVNIGGSTGMAYFRPRPLGYEAKDIVVERCTFRGSMSPVAFVGVDAAVVRYNTIYRPTRWVARILQETRKEGFVPSRRGVFERNIVVFCSNEVADFVNIGSGTAPETFTFQNNLWYSLDNPARSAPRLPVKEAGGVIGVDPQLIDPENGNFRTKPTSPARKVGIGPDVMPVSNM